MLRAAYAETLETGQERVLRNLSFISEDPETSLLIDTRTGLPFEASPEITSLNSQTTRTERFTAELTFSRDRNVIGISGGTRIRTTKSATTMRSTNSPGCSGSGN